MCTVFTLKKISFTWAVGHRHTVAFEKALSEERKRASMTLSFVAQLYGVDAKLKERNGRKKQILEKRTKQIYRKRHPGVLAISRKNNLFCSNPLADSYSVVYFNFFGCSKWGMANKLSWQTFAQDRSQPK